MTDPDFTEVRVNLFCQVIILTCCFVRSYFFLNVAHFEDKAIVTI